MSLFFCPKIFVFLPSFAGWVVEDEIFRAEEMGHEELAEARSMRRPPHFPLSFFAYFAPLREAFPCVVPGQVTNYLNKPVR